MSRKKSRKKTIIRGVPDWVTILGGIFAATVVLPALAGMNFAHGAADTTGRRVRQAIRNGKKRQAREELKEAAKKAAKEMLH